MRAALLAAIALVGCAGDIDEQWQLDHDRIIAVRATPPGILPGEKSEIDALIGAKGAHPVEQPPELARIVTPMSLSDVLAPDAGKWIVTAPDAARLDAARAELGLAPGAPVPISVGVSYSGGALLAFKTVILGETRTNPTLEEMTIDGSPAPAAATPEIVVAPLTDVRLAVKADETDVVNWLTSCGTMHDFDLPKAYLRVEKDDPAEGDLAVVRRDELGGIAWKLWTIRAE